MRFFTAILLIAYLNTPIISILFAPPEPLPWFIERIELKSFDLPSGVSIAVVENDNNQESIEIKNNSSTVLYVAGIPHLRDPEFDVISVKFPSGAGPMYKLVDGQAYKWDFELTDSELSYYYAWFPNSGYEGGNNAILLYVYENQIGSGRGKVVDLIQLNQFGGDRPDDVEIPKSQEASFPIIYGTDEINIPLTISYTLNESYYPYKPSLYLGPDFFCLILFFLVGIATVVVWGVITSNHNWLNKKSTL